mgnify:CR=1 FL=1
MFVKHVINVQIKFTISYWATPVFKISKTKKLNLANSINMISSTEWFVFHLSRLI